MIKNFNDFSNQDTLVIFDLDNTLVNVPSFEKLAIEFLKENVTIKNMLENSIRKIEVSMIDLKWENGRIFINDPNFEKQCVSNWVRKGSRIYLTTPEIFYTSDISLPISLKKLSDLYKSVENKCIVTARWENCRSRVEKRLSELGLDLPKYGLHMAPDHTRNAGVWKGHEIVKILKETGFTKAKFYDDNSKYLSKASKVVREEMPHVKWEPIKVF